jgi:hypothetical protein
LAQSFILATPAYLYPAAVLKNCGMPTDIASCILYYAKDLVLLNNGMW